MPSNKVKAAAAKTAEQKGEPKGPRNDLVAIVMSDPTKDRVRVATMFRQDQHTQKAAKAGDVRTRNYANPEPVFMSKGQVEEMMGKGVVSSYKAGDKEFPTIAFSGNMMQGKEHIGGQDGPRVWIPNIETMSDKTPDGKAIKPFDQAAYDKQAKLMGIARDTAAKAREAAAQAQAPEAAVEAEAEPEV